MSAQSVIEREAAARDGHSRDETPPPSPPPEHLSPFSPERITLTLGVVLTVAGVAFETLAVATVLPAVVADLGGLNL
jgi:hypothetical protein